MFTLYKALEPLGVDVRIRITTPNKAIMPPWFKVLPEVKEKELKNRILKRKQGINYSCSKDQKAV